MEKPEIVTDVEYPKAKFYKRWFAGIIDVFLMALLGMIFFSLEGLITVNVPDYQNMLHERNFFQLESRLYVTNADGNVITLLESTDNSAATEAEKKQNLSDALDYFYEDATFFADNSGFNDYQTRKKDATNGSSPIFTLKEGTYVENGFSDSVYLDFYYSEIEHHAMGRLTENVTYSAVTRSIFLIAVGEGLLGFGLGFLLTFCVVPLILKRGRKTLGMYLFHISLIGADALNVKGKAFFLRSLLVFGVGFLLDVVAILIPFVVSITMMYLSKTGQDFFDYVTNTYVVDTTKKDVYRDYSEYLSRMGGIKEATLTNNDFRTTDKK
jgi:uncharacterized RDD family membrane protein YckC